MVDLTVFCIFFPDMYSTVGVSGAAFVVLLLVSCRSTLAIKHENFDLLFTSNDDTLERFPVTFANPPQPWVKGIYVRIILFILPKTLKEANAIQ